MPLSWNEIKDRAIKFSKDWANASNEDADSKPFLIYFFNVFGITNRRVATFEYRIQKHDDTNGYIDLLWKGMILIEMKSRGKNLDKAYNQALEYTQGLLESELPKFILICDFETFHLYDLEENNKIEFKLKNLVDYVQYFAYLLGYQKNIYQEQDPANLKAAELMGKLHDRLEDIGYNGHSLELYLVRILFCLFAEDTTIFNKKQFQDYIEQRTLRDGSDLAAKLQELFQVLNTSLEKRYKNLDEQLADFPYINGKLFEEILPTASFDSKMRQALLNCCYFDWSKISPAIFGSMFQSVMNPIERRHLGAHYTSESNILKLIKPLFLDELWKEFNLIKDSKNKLLDFHKKLSTLKFLDPACGCGNFLVITYRELRLLEFEILKVVFKTEQKFLNISDILLIHIDQFCGIEYEEFPARIAEVAMWLIDHQMNMIVSQAFGQYFIRMPLDKSAHIVNSDALEMDWHCLLNPNKSLNVVSKHTNIYLLNEPQSAYNQVNVQTETFSVIKGKPELKSDLKFDYIIGNPPFIGSKMMTPYQRNQIVKLCSHAKGGGLLDYVTGWYIKAAQYIQNTLTKVAFVSTNSIVQGEQTAILWHELLHKYQLKIHFAHRTFKWHNEAKGNAAVFCVIIGFANYDTTNKIIFEYDDIKGEAHAFKAKHINPYLVDASNVLIDKRLSPLCKVPKIKFGNQPIDGGGLILSEAEKIEAIKQEPFIKKFIRPYFGSYDFINGKKRYCLWFDDNNMEPSKLQSSQFIMERLAKVKKFRLESSRKDTQKLAETPSQFAFKSHEETGYIIIPGVSSEKRKYIPIGFMPANNIASNGCLIIPNATLYHFGILTSQMHMAWVKYVCGRLKSDFRYSNGIVYNNFPWPEKPSPKQLKAIEIAAQQVLDIRLTFPKSTLANLYDPLTMPNDLVKAHHNLDKAVDLAYRPQPFINDANRMVYLFELYESYKKGLFD